MVNGYIVFFNHSRKTNKAFKGLSIGEGGKKAGEMWRAMSAAKKAEWNAKAVIQTEEDKKKPKKAKSIKHKKSAEHKPKRAKSSSRKSSTKKKHHTK